MSSQRPWQNYNPQQPLGPRATKKTSLVDWKPYSDLIQAWCRQGIKTRDMVALLMQRGVVVTENQLHNYKKNAGLRRPNRRTAGTTVAMQSLTLRDDDLKLQDDDLTLLNGEIIDFRSEAIGMTFPSVPSSGGASGDIESEVDRWELRTEHHEDAGDDTRVSHVEFRQKSSGDYESSHDETASEMLDTLDSSRCASEDGFADTDQSSIANFATDLAADESPALSSSAPQEEHLSYFTSIQRIYGESDLSETLLSSPRISPPSSVYSHPANGGSEAMSTDDISSKSSRRTFGQVMDEYSSKSSVTTRRASSWKVGLGRSWIYAHDAAKWSAAMQIGRVLDVMDTSIPEHDRQQPLLSGNRLRKRYNRIVVVRIIEGVACGVPVRTYRGRGVSALTQSQKEAHAILHALDTMPSPVHGESHMSKRPLVAKISSSALCLSPSSLINFARPCIIGPAMALRKVGKIDLSSRSLLETYSQQYLHASAD